MTKNKNIDRNKRTRKLYALQNALATLMTPPELYPGKNKVTWSNFSTLFTGIFPRNPSEEMFRKEYVLRFLKNRLESCIINVNRQLQEVKGTDAKAEDVVAAFEIGKKDS